MHRQYRYWGIGYWPILASIGWYWYRPNTFLSNRAQYWADNSLRHRLTTHDDLISHACVSARLQSNTCNVDHWRSWETLVKQYTDTSKVLVWNPIPTVNLPRVTSHHSRQRSNDWSCLMPPSVCAHHASWQYQTASVSIGCGAGYHSNLQRSSDYLPSYPPDKHQSSDAVYWRGELRIKRIKELKLCA